MRRVAERVFIVLLLFYYMAPFGFFFTDMEGSTPGVLKNQALALALNLTINGIAALILLPNWRTCVQGFRRAGWVIVLPALACLSVFWSDVPFLVFRRLVYVAIGTSFGVYLGAKYSRAELLRLTAWSLTIVMVLSVAFALLVPDLGTAQAEEHLGNWQGIFHRKNILGRTMTLGALVFLVFPVVKKAAAIRLAGFITCVGLLLLSKSATGVIVLAIVVTVVVVSSRSSSPSPMVRVAVWTLFLMTTGTILFLVATNWSSALVTLGRDVTLTGRTELWRAVIVACWQRPWFGYGWEGFWSGRQGLHMISDYGLLFSHNGFLDLGLQLGLLGLAVCGIGFITVLRRALWYLRNETDPDSVWPIGYLTFLVTYNITETTFMDVNSVYWLLYVALAAAPAFTGFPSLLTPSQVRRQHDPVRKIGVNPRRGRNDF